MVVPGWGSPRHTSGKEHVQLLNYVIEITFITSIPQSKQFLSTQNKSSISQSSFHLCFPWVLGPTLVLPVIFFLPDITDTSPTAEENKEEAWPAIRDITLDPSQIKNTSLLSAIQHMFTKHQLCVPHHGPSCRCHQKSFPGCFTFSQKRGRDSISATFQKWQTVNWVAKKSKFLQTFYRQKLKFYLWNLVDVWVSFTFHGQWSILMIFFNDVEVK